MTRTPAGRLRLVPTPGIASAERDTNADQAGTAFRPGPNTGTTRTPANRFHPGPAPRITSAECGTHAAPVGAAQFAQQGALA